MSLYISSIHTLFICINSRNIVTILSGMLSFTCANLNLNLISSQLELIEFCIIKMNYMHDFNKQKYVTSLNYVNGVNIDRAQELLLI